MRIQSLRLKTLRFCLFTLLFVAKPVYSQTYSLSIWPPLLEVLIQPGRTITQVYRLSNAGDDQILTAKILPFEPKDELGNINLVNLPKLLNPLSFSFQGGDVSLGKPFILKSGESKDLVLKLVSPVKTPERDFYVSLIFETNPETRVGLSQTQAAAKIVSNLLITVSIDGQPQKQARIIEFSAPKIVDSFDPVPFTLKVENTNTAFFKPFGEIKIEGIFSQKGKIKIVPENILAGSTRNLQIAPWKEKFILGPFRATVSFTLDETEEKLSLETNFVALPYKATLALIIVLLIFQALRNLPQKMTGISSRQPDLNNLEAPKQKLEKSGPT